MFNVVFGYGQAVQDLGHSTFSLSICVPPQFRAFDFFSFYLRSASGGAGFRAFDFFSFYLRSASNVKEGARG